MNFKWHKNDIESTASCCAQRVRTPDYYGRAVTPSVAKLEIVNDMHAALGTMANREGFLRTSNHTRMRGRCDGDNYVAPERYMQMLPYAWQQAVYPRALNGHITRNDIMDCRGVDMPIWKQNLVIKPPSAGKPTMVRTLGRTGHLVPTVN
jgi:hypothetical protein